jgi:hypothetical protein
MLEFLRERRRQCNIEIADEAILWAKAGAKHLALLARQAINE